MCVYGLCVVCVKYVQRSCVFVCEVWGVCEVYVMCVCVCVACVWWEIGEFGNCL